jgi:hypothetical protein
LNTSWYSSAFTRDIERAKKEVTFEDKIWLCPGLKETKRWVRKIDGFTFSECAIPSETRNTITIVRVSKERDLYPPFGDGIPETWKAKLPKGLLEKWLNCNGPFSADIGNIINMQVPLFREKKVFFPTIPVQLQPGPIMPNTHINEKGVTFTWPSPDSYLLDSISPETESFEKFGRYQWNPSKNNGIDNVLNSYGKTATHIGLSWPPPFNEMFQLGGGVDLIKQKDHMKECIENLEDKKSEISSMASKFSSQGQTTLEKLVINPTLMTNTHDELFFILEGRYNIVVQNLDELINHKKYKEIFLKTVPVTNIFGWEGFFWWELNNLVNNLNKSVKHCILCGNVISGKKDKEHCGKKDNKPCYNKRRAADKWRVRNS